MFRVIATIENYIISFATKKQRLAGHLLLIFLGIQSQLLTLKENFMNVPPNNAGFSATPVTNNAHTEDVATTPTATQPTAGSSSSARDSARAALQQRMPASSRGVDGPRQPTASEAQQFSTSEAQQFSTSEALQFLSQFGPPGASSIYKSSKEMMKDAAEKLREPK